MFVDGDSKNEFFRLLLRSIVALVGYWAAHGVADMTFSGLVFNDPDCGFYFLTFLDDPKNDHPFDCFFFGSMI